MSYLHKRRKKLLINVVFAVIVFTLALILTILISNRKQNQATHNVQSIFSFGKIKNADADADQKLDFSDVMTVLNNWGMNADGAIDQYADGKVNSLDFAVVSNSIQK